MTDNEWLTMMGLCHKCRKQKVAPNKKFCFDCLDKKREENAKWYAEHGLQWSRQYQERRNEIRREKIENGTCIMCRKPATHGKYCYEHSIYMKRKNMMIAYEKKMKRHEKGLLKDKWRREGLCLWCREKAAVEGINVCERHSKIFSMAGKKGKAVATSQQKYKKIVPAQFPLPAAECTETNRQGGRWNDED